MTVPPAEQPPSAKALQQHGYTTQTRHDTLEETQELTIQLLSTAAKLPVRASESSAGYDVFSPVAAIIPPGQCTLVPLDIAANPPSNTYLQVALQRGLAATHLVDTKAGVIDADLSGNITVVLHNSGSKDFHIHQGDCIAQLLVLPIQHPVIKVMDDMPGSGSTGQPAIIHTAMAPIDPPEMPFDIYLSQDPFDRIQHIDITVKGDHPMLGLNLTPCTARNRLRLIYMHPGTPSSRLPKWRSVLRNSYLLTI
jgi:dUTP pyrophosphatase